MSARPTAVQVDHWQDKNTNIRLLHPTTAVMQLTSSLLTSVLLIGAHAVIVKHHQAVIMPVVQHNGDRYEPNTDTQVQGTPSRRDAVADSPDGKRDSPDWTRDSSDRKRNAMPDSPDWRRYAEPQMQRAAWKGNALRITPTCHKRVTYCTSLQERTSSLRFIQDAKEDSRWPS